MVDRLPTYDLDGMFATRSFGELITIEPAKSTVVRLGAIESDETEQEKTVNQPAKASKNTQTTPAVRITEQTKPAQQKENKADRYIQIFALVGAAVLLWMITKK